MSARPSLSVALPPSRDIVEYARTAAGCGYERLWVFDSPALYGDLWIALARVADAVPDIKLATGVAVPSLRHPMVTASAIASISELAPGRLWVYFGTGFTARLTMGKRGMPWADLSTYLQQVRGLLKGDVVDIDGAACQLIHSPGWGPALPLDVPLGLAPIGPKGFSVSRELADGVILTMPTSESVEAWPHVALLVNGTVLEPGEDLQSEHILAAVGPAYVAGVHAMWSWSPDLAEGLPGGAGWLSSVNAEQPEERRHLAVHEGHFVTVTDRDRPLLAAAGDKVAETGWTGDAASIAQRMADAAATGITEVVFNPAGSDIRRELVSFAKAAL